MRLKKFSLSLSIFFAIGQVMLPVLVQAESLPATYTLPESYYNSLKSQTLPAVAADTKNFDATKYGDLDSPNAVSVKVNKKKKYAVKKDYSQAYYETEIGGLKADIAQIREELAKIGDMENQYAGYDGSFFLRDKDDKFRFNINLRFQARYSVNIAEDTEDGHTLNMRRLFLMFSGHAFTEKATYFLLVIPTAAGLVFFDFGYDLHPAFSLHFVRDSVYYDNGELSDSSKSLMFISSSLVGSRFDLGDSLAIVAAGGIGKFSYDAGVWQGMGGGYGPNANNELAFGGKVKINLINKVSGGQSDVTHSDKPSLAIGFGGAFGHKEDGTQARVIGGSSNIRFKYKGFSYFIGGIYRQIDPDEFTRAQTDVGVSSYAGIFIIPKKLEFGIRASMLFDDITESGNGIDLGAGMDTRLGPDALGGGDVGADASNEWESSAAINYYFKGYKAKVQAQYSFVHDGVQGPDDLIYHLGMLQVQLNF